MAPRTEPALYTDPEDGVLRMAAWWGDLEAADPARQPRFPSLIVTGAPDLEAFPDLAALGQRLARLLDGRPPVLIRSVGTYEGYDTFPAFSVHARAPAGDNGGPPAAVYLYTVAVQKVTAGELEQAIAAAGQRQVGRGAP